MVNQLYEIWVRDDESSTYYIGTEHDGCGVFPEDGGWTGNVALGNHIECVGMWHSQDEAREACIELWHRKREALGYEPFDKLPTKRVS